MTDVSARNFGILIAYVIPGFAVVATVSRDVPIIRFWLGGSSVGTPTIGGFLYVTLASVAFGMVVSALRWLLLDSVHHHTGIRRPEWDFSLLQRNRAAVLTLVEQHYRYYQFFGNSLIATLLAATRPASLYAFLPTSPPVALVAIALLLILLFVASRDALQKYYLRTAALLGEDRRTGQQ